MQTRKRDIDSVYCLRELNTSHRLLSWADHVTIINKISQIGESVAHSLDALITTPVYAARFRLARGYNINIYVIAPGLALRACRT
jgi:hypothetical protein